MCTVYKMSISHTMKKQVKIYECNTFKAFRVIYFRQLLMTGFCSFNNKMHSCKKQINYTVNCKTVVPGSKAHNISTVCKVLCFC